MKSTVAALAAAFALALTGCAGDAAGTSTPAPSAAASDGTQAFLQAHGLDGLETTQIIEKLEVSQEDRTQGPMGSVRPDELLLTDGNNEVTLPIEDRFYLSIAPYENRTHDCFNHNLATCQGELTGTPFEVKVVADDGTTHFADTMTSHANGFAGIWLPKDLTGTITVSANGKQAQSAIGTGANDPTCLTTLQLT